MAFLQFKNVRIAGLSAGVPKQIRRNLDRSLHNISEKYTPEASLVFTSSIAAVTMAHGNGLYSATTSYMRTCAREFADKKIKANAVLSGMVATKLIENGSISAEEKQKDAESYPLKRYGTPNDIAWGIIYVLSEASGRVTGTCLYIDGGKK